MSTVSRRLLVLLALTLLLPSAAQAHAILIDSQPVPHATVPPGPTHIVLRYNSRIDQARSRLELRPTSPEATPQRLLLSPSPKPDTLIADTTLPVGTWVLRWQVLAVDGHITRGDVPLTVRAP